MVNISAAAYLQMRLISEYIRYVNIIFPFLLLTLNVPFQIGKSILRGTSTPLYELLVFN